MSKNQTRFLSWIGVVSVIAGTVWSVFRLSVSGEKSVVEGLPSGSVIRESVQEKIQKVVVVEPGERAVVGLPTHYFQTFNNCGPATLTMVLNYYGVSVDQGVIGRDLRPYQNAAGDNDDKSVTFEEMARKAEEIGFVAYHRPAGSVELLKKFTANGIPVMTRTWTTPNEDIGHYRVVRGYDESEGVIIQDDSLQGKDIEYEYEYFLSMWDKFNYEYLVVVEEENSDIAEAILGEHLDPHNAWAEARNISSELIRENPQDETEWFNLSVALYHLEDYRGSVEAFERVEARLPFRTLWYQIEPLLAYQKLGMRDALFSRIERILTTGNRAYSELYQIRGEVYLSEGNIASAREQFELAIFYNVNYDPASEALAEIDD